MSNIPSSPSSSSSLLTPDSTGSVPGPSRRLTASYPSSASSPSVKPFSRSAAKRESVMALGSIEHLQYYFTKTGLTSSSSSLPGKGKGLFRPAIGPLSTSISIPDDDENRRVMVLPPTPVQPTPPRPQFDGPHVRTTHIDPDTLLPGVISDLHDVEQAWTDGDEVLELLKKSTKAIRSVRNYVMVLPSESAGTIRTEYWSKYLARPTTASASSTTTTASERQDPLRMIRKAALKVLETLRELEEKSRLPLTDDAYDSEPHSSPPAPPPLTASPPPPSLSPLPPSSPLAFSFLKVQGRDESIPVWEDNEPEGWSDDEQTLDSSTAAASRWDDRLVLGSGWLYRQDMTSDELERERGVMMAYLDVVDQVLFKGNSEERGWLKEKKRLDAKYGGKRLSSGSSSSDVDGERMLGFQFPPPTHMGSLTEEPEEDEFVEREEEDLPEWAKHSTFANRPLDRAHNLISSLLSPPYTPLPQSRAELLESLSSGQILCMAYNAAIRQSHNPWGYINKDSVHDILSLEKRRGGVGEGRTFRRKDNLRLWVGGLMLRYTVPIVQPPSSSTLLPLGADGRSVALPQTISPRGSTISSSATTRPDSAADVPRRKTGESTLMFDLKVVASKEEGWDDMLENVLNKWVERVVEEERMRR